MTIAFALGTVLVVLVVSSVETIGQMVVRWGELYDDFGIIRYDIQAELRRTTLALLMRLSLVAIVLYLLLL